LFGVGWPSEPGRQLEWLRVLEAADAIDAGVIAHFADAFRPAPKPMPDDVMLRLREQLLARPRQLVIMINAEKQRFAKAADTVARRSFKNIQRSLEAERALIDRPIDKLIEQTRCFVPSRICSRACPVSVTPSPALLVELSELGSVDRRPRRCGPDEPRQ
jgi:transposase